MSRAGRRQLLSEGSVGAEAQSLRGGKLGLEASGSGSWSGFGFRVWDLEV